MDKHKVNIIEAAMKYKQVMLIVVTMFILLGIYAFLSMPRQEMPKIDMPVAMVYAFYPGANEVQTEKEVTNKIEQYLFSFAEIEKKKTTSQTRNGQVFITVQLYTSVKDRNRFWTTLQHGLNTTLRQSLPLGVIGPVVNSNFGDVSAQIITVSSATRSYSDLEKYADKVEDALKIIPTVSKINRSGGQKQQIYITVDDKKMQQYGFDLSTVIKTLQAQNVTGYSGEMTITSNTIPVFTNSQYKTEANIANQIIYTTPQGVVVRLKDVANIQRRYEEPSSYIRIDNDKVLMLNTEMKPGNNIVQFGKTVEEKLNTLKAVFPSDIKINVLVNQPAVVKESIRHFMSEFFMAIVGVIIVVMLLLPIRVAAVASLAAPVSIFITFGLLNIIHIELHQVTLIGMVVVLGMVVDNAIIVVDNYIEKIDEGLTPWTAAWQSAWQLSVPIFTATLAIIFAFIPFLFFLEGIAGDFVSALPITVAVALTVSMLVAFFLTPYTCYVFIKKGLKHKLETRKTSRKSILDHLQDNFNRTVELAFRWPKTTLALAAISIVAALKIASTIDMEFFPLNERNQFNIEVWMPNGTSLDQTGTVVKRVEEIMKKDKRVVSTTSFVGTSSPRFQVTYAPEIPRRNYAQIFVTTISNDATSELVKEYLPRFKGFVPDGYIRLHQLSFQEGSPIEVRVIGDNINDQKRVAEQVKTILQNIQGTNWVRSNYEDDYFGISLNIKEDAASRLGVPNQAITQTLGAGLTGFSVSQIWEGDKPVDIFLRLDSNSRKDYNDLGNLHVNSMFGSRIPLKEVADLIPSWHTGVIAHRNGLRTLGVLSEAQLGIKASAILKIAQPQIEKLQLPEGIRIAYGGDAESTVDNIPGMAVSLSVAMVLIFLTLLFQFKNLAKSVIILCTFPLSLLGAFLGLKLTGNPLGVTGFLGIISLIGIVVRSGIILVDYADELVLDYGLTIKAAALAAAKRRMRPVFLTSIAAAVGVIPMILSRSPMWSPLGSVLSFGLVVSMVFTLFVVPIMYYLFIRPKPAKEPLDADVEIRFKPLLNLFKRKD
jgi:multidrug efflux pump subunit AcrB